MSRFCNSFGAFEIDSLPGQSQVAVCHSFVVPEDLRGNGHGHQLKARQEIELDTQHYDLAICTVAAGNARQKRVLAQAGWQHLRSFRNRRSSETTELWCRGGQPEGPVTLTRIRQLEAEKRDQYNRQAGLIVAGFCSFITAAGCVIAWLALCPHSF